MPPKNNTTIYATTEDLTNLKNQLNALTNAAMAAATKDDISKMNAAMDEKMTRMQDEMQRLQNELHGQIQLVKQRDEELAIAQADNERMLQIIVTMQKEKRGMEEREEPQVQPRTPIPPRPIRANGEEWQEVNRHRSKNTNPNLRQVEVQPKSGSRKTVMKTVDVRAMSYAQVALVNHQEAMEKARKGDKTEFEVLLDKQLARQRARANPDLPRTNRHGELLQRTERMVRLKVNMSWIPKETLNPIQYVRMALNVKSVPYVEEISFLGRGRSWAEWFVDERHVDDVKAWLRASGTDYEEGFNPMAPPPHNPMKPVADTERTVIWRRALVLQKGRFRAIKEAALEGVPDNVREEIQSLAFRLRQGTAKGWKWPKQSVEEEVADFDQRQHNLTRGFQPITLAEGVAVLKEQNRLFGPPGEPRRGSSLNMLAARNAAAAKALALSACNEEDESSEDEKTEEGEMASPVQC
jgi:hypothetical protein